MVVAAADHSGDAAIHCQSCVNSDTKQLDVVTTDPATSTPPAVENFSRWVQSGAMLLRTSLDGLRTILQAILRKPAGYVVDTVETALSVKLAFG